MPVAVPQPEPYAKWSVPEVMASSVVVSEVTEPGGVRYTTYASRASAIVNGTLIELPETVAFPLYTGCGELHCAESWIRSTSTWVTPPDSSQAAEPKPFTATVTAPV